MARSINLPLGHVLPPHQDELCQQLIAAALVEPKYP